MISDRDGLPAIRVTAPGATIPRVIHQTFPIRDLPIELRRNVDRLLATNAGWEHRLYDNDDIVKFIADEYGEAMLARYLQISPRYGAARADLFRYLLIYRTGGVYLDIKSFSERPLNEALRPNDRYVLSHWRNQPGFGKESWGVSDELPGSPRGEFQQWHVIAVSGHPFLRAVIERVLHNIEDYRPWKHGTGRRAVLSTTGPIAYTQAIQPMLPLYPHRLVEDNTDLGLGYSFLGDFEHQALFASHYTRVAEPLVIQNGVIALTSLAFLATRAAANVTASCLRKQPFAAAAARRVARLVRRRRD